MVKEFMYVMFNFANVSTNDYTDICGNKGIADVEPDGIVHGSEYRNGIHSIQTFKITKNRTKKFLEWLCEKEELETEILDVRGKRRMFIRFKDESLRNNINM